MPSNLYASSLLQDSRSDLHCTSPFLFQCVWNQIHSFFIISSHFFSLSLHLGKVLKFPQTCRQKLSVIAHCPLLNHQEEQSVLSLSPSAQPCCSCLCSDSPRTPLDCSCLPVFLYNHVTPPCLNPSAMQFQEWFFFPKNLITSFLSLKTFSNSCPAAKRSLVSGIIPA